MVGTTPPAKVALPSLSPRAGAICMDTAERDTTLVGAAPAWKLRDEESIEKAIACVLRVGEACQKLRQREETTKETTKETTFGLRTEREGC